MGITAGSLPFVMHLLFVPPSSICINQVGIAGGELIAVGRFDGYITPAAAEEARQKLLQALERGQCRK